MIQYWMEDRFGQEYLINTFFRIRDKEQATKYMKKRGKIKGLNKIVKLVVLNPREEENFVVRLGRAAALV